MSTSNKPTGTGINGNEVPRGWSNTPDDLSVVDQSFPSSIYPIPILSKTKGLLAETNSNGTGEARFLVQVDDAQCYIWNSLNDGLWKIKTPAQLKDIVASMQKDPRLNGLQLEEAVEDLGGPQVEIVT